MVDFVIEKIRSMASSATSNLEASSVLVLEQTFKKDISDTRNSKAIVLTERLEKICSDVTSYDPFVQSSNLKSPFGSQDRYDIVVVTVPDTTFLESETSLSKLVRPSGILVDLTGEVAQAQAVTSTLTYWRL